MKTLRYISSFIILIILFYSCATSPIKNNSNTKEEPVVIKNDSLEYEITIIDIGFTSYLNSIAKPEGFYSESYLENRNRMMVPIWNNRVNNPFNFNTNIYENIECTVLNL